MEISAGEVTTLGREELVELYSAVGWSAYTRDPDALLRAVRGSHRVCVARDRQTLVGLARTISDGVTVVYLQDVLVRPSHQRTGLGRELLTRLLGTYGDIRQQVLLTDDRPEQRAFYSSLGFVETHDHEPPLRSFVRLR
ncbi:GNAT family N-acetyltransferase [Ruania alkalisoli]|uniref:GNAT family N-acetyltransferase n=1 Tax=Ruania alkalisoli TaxID=2779775 RepID=A0A7M1SXZ0_9MICO|nr:GNAT family N-acetyltransferase [Ruania alkalisoli]QOR71844.1 GNAT family N-acetyltransferase [Ruania alkalisoli]